MTHNVTFLAMQIAVSEKLETSSTENCERMNQQLREGAMKITKYAIFFLQYHNIITLKHCQTDR